jgi:hypothetical protein
MVDGRTRKPISTGACTSTSGSVNPGSLSDLSCGFYSDAGYWCKTLGNVPRQDGAYCLAKPVIYLYPEQKTNVDVKVLFANGYVYVSDPLYDTVFHGWDNVEAHPDGTLLYQGGTYHELYYETATDMDLLPTNGIIIPTVLLEKRLREITHQLGLHGREQEEFLTYWLPKLHELDAPYLLVSLISPEMKKQVDEVVIDPKPDTFIEVLFYFKPLPYPVAVTPLLLPPTPPERIGFTAVEWGGTIDFGEDPVQRYSTLH